MSEIASARIKTLPQIEQTDFVKPSGGQLVTVPSSLLEALQNGIDTLEDRIIKQDEKIAVLESTVDHLDEKIDQEHSNTAFERALDRQRITRLEQKETETTKRTTTHIDELYRLMIEDKTQQIGLAKAARLLDLSKERVRQLKPLILADGRFDLGWANQKGQKGAVIRIRQYLK